MFDRRKKLQARFYATASGQKPVREWILGLDKADRVIVGKDIQKVEFGWPIGMPSCRPLGSSLYEVRSDLAGGRIARVMFCIVKGEAVLLHGFMKKSQKTPAGDIEMARKRQKDVKS
ncbi:MAG: type II toxin-antitoxin system RelE/ParE family toxin [Rhizobiales bacterium]|nr:type II toxin-antitoxin system RelE/ParE family toxin [Hyphomicrobiales bacterium]